MDSERSDLTSFHVRRAIGGDRASLEWMITHLTPLLEAQTAWRLEGLEARAVDAADLVSEAWMVALPRLGELRPRAGRMAPVLIRFLSSIVTRKLLNLARKRARRGEREAMERDDGEVLEARVADEASGVLARVAEREGFRSVARALAQLGPEEREAFILRAVEGWRNDQAAAILDERPNTVAKRYRRALEKLRERLAPEIGVTLFPAPTESD